LSVRSGNSGYPRHGDGGAAILQKACELSSSITEPVVTCRHTDKVDCVQCTATFVCFREIKVFAGQQTCFKYAVTIKFVAVQYTTFE
jgi:hypothetical protein